MSGRSSAGENPLVNPGFESINLDGNPAGWDVFVLPQDGALGRISSEAFSGKHSVSLYNPEAYANDPANNWSQVVYGEFRGKTITVAAQLRSEEVGGAGLWVQCFQKSPLSVAAIGTSEAESEFTGTRAWSQVRAAVVAPSNTDFVVVRCVIRGAGRAWFDDVQFEFSEPAAVVEAEGVSAGEDSGRAASVEFETVRRQLQASLDLLKESNNGLQAQIGALQIEIEALRSQLRDLPSIPAELKPAPESPANPAPGATEPGHVLVPRTGEEKL